MKVILSFFCGFGLYSRENMIGKGVLGGERGYENG